MRTQVAIFVDAGYMFALGSIALTGSALPRPRMGVHVEPLQDSLKKVVREVAGAKPIVRTYWYDNSTSNRAMSNEQLKIGEIDGIKLRLVALHQQNVKTGTASAIARDLIELSSKGSISDALVLARNDTLRTAIEICQSYGIRVHILEIFPEEKSQFSYIKSDVDTLTSWNATDLREILFEQELAMESEYQHVYPTRAPSDPDHEPRAFSFRRSIHASADVNEDTKDSIISVVKDFIEELYDDELESCMEFWRTGRGVPNTYDKSLLIECRNALDRNLTDSERQVMRSSFKDVVTAKLQGDQVYDDDESSEESDEFEVRDEDRYQNFGDSGYYER